MDMHAALTKGGLPKVQKVSAVERAMYKMNDLKQVCLSRLLLLRYWKDCINSVLGPTEAICAGASDAWAYCWEQEQAGASHLALPVNFSNGCAINIVWS